MEPKEPFRKLHLYTPRPRRINNRFALLAGIAVAVLFLACVAMAYVAHRTHTR